MSVLLEPSNLEDIVKMCLPLASEYAVRKLS